MAPALESALTAPHSVERKARRAVTPMARQVVLALFIVLAAVSWWRSFHPDSGTPGSRVIAILPPQNLGDSSDAYFADGVTDEIRTLLSQVAGIEVIARGSCNQYRDSPLPPDRIARELGVRYLLTMTVRWDRQAGAASRVRVTPELVEIRSGAAPRTRWQQEFDAALTDVFEVQGNIAGQVARALDIALSDSARRQLAARLTRNPAAYDAFLRGDKILITDAKTDLASTREAADAYAEAIRRDSTFALAWARLARAEALRYATGYGNEHRDSVAQAARQAAERALALAPERAETYFALSYVHALVNDSIPGAVEAIRHAYHLAPGDADVVSLAAGVLWVEGRSDEWAGLFATAARLDPRSVSVARRYSDALMLERRFKEADSVASAGLRLAPDNLELIERTVESRLAEGDVPGAKAGVREALRHVDPARYVRYQDPSMFWVDDSLVAFTLRQPPEELSADRAAGLLTLADVEYSVGRYEAARAHADSAARLMSLDRIRQSDDPSLAYRLAIAASWSGQRQAAEAALARYHDLSRPERSRGYWAAWIRLRRWVEQVGGDRPGTVALLDSLLRLPGSMTRARLRVDPNMNPLRELPEFQRLVAAGN